MGNVLCCSTRESIENEEDRARAMNYSRRMSLLQDLRKSSTPEPGLLSRHQLSNSKSKPVLLPQNSQDPTIAFQLQYNYQIKHLSFAQRRYIGFRKRYQFDKKRILVAGVRDVTVIGFHEGKQPCDLLKYIVSDYNEEIRFASFIEDNIPVFIFLIIYNKLTEKSQFRILKMKKNKLYEQDFKIEESNNILQDQVLLNYHQGNFTKKRKKSYDNLELVPTKEMKIRKSQAHRHSKSNVEDIMGPDNSRRSVNVTSSNRSSFSTMAGLLGRKTQQQRNQTNESPQKQLSSSVMYQLDNSMVNKAQSMGIDQDLIRHFEMKLNEEEKVESSEDSKGNEKASNPFSPAKMEDVDSKLTTEQCEEIYPFECEEFGCLELPDNILKAKLFSNPIGTILFTFEENNKVSIYLIKSYVNHEVMKLNHNYYLKSSQVSNFKMAKKATLQLEYPPLQVEFYGEYFIISYKIIKSDIKDDQTGKSVNVLNYHNLLDVFDKSGRPLSRIDMSDIMKQKSIQLVKISKVLFSRLQWSNRKIEEFDLTKSTVLKKVIVTGECVHEDKRRPFILKINLETNTIELVKILKLEDKITAIGYGPFDNGHVIIGLKSGLIIVFDLIKLEKITSVPLFLSPVLQITFEPTNLVIVGSQTGEVKGLSFIPKEMHYVYLEIGKKQYCTATINDYIVNAEDDDTLDHSQSNHKLFCL